jgi:hypothetical protein
MAREQMTACEKLAKSAKTAAQWKQLYLEVCYLKALIIGAEVYARERADD